jgi:hydroxymethylbilane synthase
VSGLTRVRIATRKSALALWQAEFIRDRLLGHHPDVEVELVPMSTSGDRWLSSPLSEVGGKGLFIKELEQAMIDDVADLAVHSMKDVPADLPAGFALPVIAFRDDVRDALVSRHGGGLAGLPEGAVVGSSSLRRQAQLLAYRPDLRVKPVRGNVNTRLDKLDAGDYEALMLACAGLERLAMRARISERIALDVSLPAAGQGALGIECREDRTDLIDVLGALVEPQTAACVTAERAVSRGLGADCSMPLAAYAESRASGVWVRARLASADGQRVLDADAVGDDPETVGTEVAGALKTQGADEILAELRAP